MKVELYAAFGTLFDVHPIGKIWYLTLKMFMDFPELPRKGDGIKLRIGSNVELGEVEFVEWYICSVPSVQIGVRIVSVRTRPSDTQVDDWCNNGWKIVKDSEVVECG